MTDLIQALSTALARLATLEEMASRLERLERTIALVEINGSHEARLDKLEDRVQRLGLEAHEQITINHLAEIRLKTLEENSGESEDLEDRIGEILDRKLDHVLEDAVTEALSGREITICL